MTRLRPNHRTPINLACECERDFTGVKSCFDFSIGKQLSRRVAAREGNLHLFPDRIETIARDSIDHRNKRLASGQTGVRLVNKIEGVVVLKESPFSGRWEFHKLNFEQIAIVIGWYYAGRTVPASSARRCHEC